MPKGETLDRGAMCGVLGDGSWDISLEGEDSVIWIVGRGEEETVEMSKVAVRYA